MAYVSMNFSAQVVARKSKLGPTKKKEGEGRKVTLFAPDKLNKVRIDNNTG